MTICKKNKKKFPIIVNLIENKHMQGHEFTFFSCFVSEQNHHKKSLSFYNIQLVVKNYPSTSWALILYRQLREINHVCTVLPHCIMGNLQYFRAGKSPLHPTRFAFCTSSCLDTFNFQSNIQKQRMRPCETWQTC